MIGVGCELNSQNLQKERAGGAGGDSKHMSQKGEEGVAFVKMRTDLQFFEPFGGPELGESESQLHCHCHRLLVGPWPLAGP